MLAKKLAQLFLQMTRPGSARGAGGQTVTSFKCPVCENDFAHADTSVPWLCPGCEREVRALASRDASSDEWIAVFATASLSHHSVQLQKFSGATNPGDIQSPEMSEEMRARITRSTVGKVWRARIGRQRRWHYGWDACEALRNALNGGGVRLTTPIPQLERELEELERTNPEVSAAARQLDRVTHGIIGKNKRGGM